MSICCWGLGFRVLAPYIVGIHILYAAVGLAGRTIHIYTLFNPTHPPTFRRVA